MNMAIDLVLTAFLGICLMLSASSRLVHCIRLVALQGILLGVLPLLMWNWSKACPGAEIWGAAFVNIMVKGVLLPILLIRAMRKAGVKRELEPLAGYSWSLLIVSVAGALALWLSSSLTIPGVSILAIPAAAVTVFTGLFIIVSRRKAITQSLGFLAFENGIALFGAATLGIVGGVVGGTANRAGAATIRITAAGTHAHQHDQSQQQGCHSFHRFFSPLAADQCRLLCSV